MRFKNSFLYLLTLSLFLVVPGGISYAQEARRIVAKDKTDEVIRVHLAPGFGVSLSFVNSQESIQKVWLDNPAFVTVSPDGCLQGLGQNCSSLGAKILHLRRIETLNLQGIPKSKKTLLTVITKDGSNNPQLYLFSIQPSSQPQTLVFEIEGNRPKQEVVVETVKTPQVDYFLLAAIERGIKITLSEGWIEGNSPLIGNLRRLTTLLAKGYQETEAAQIAGISPPLLERLKKLGDYIDVPQILREPPGSQAMAPSPNVGSLSNQE